MVGVEEGSLSPSPRVVFTPLSLPLSAPFEVEDGVKDSPSEKTSPLDC